MTVSLPRGRVLALGGLSSFGPLALDLYLPALPQLTADLRATEAAGQLSLSVCMIGLALGQLLVGPFTDRVGRRVPLLVGVGLFAVTAALCAAAPSIELLLALRLLSGLAGGAGLVIARAMVRDLYDGALAARMFALLMLVSNIAPVVAPLLGGLVLRVADWRGVFLVLAAVGVVLLGAALTQAETLPADRRRTGGLRGVATVLRDVVRDRRFIVPAVVQGIGVCGMFVYIAMASFVLQGTYGLDPQGFAIVFGVNAVAIVLVGRLSAQLVGRVGPRRLLAAGVVVALLAAVAMLVGVLLSRSVWALLPPLLVLVSCTGVIMPNATALALADQGRAAGTASAVIGLLQFAFAAIVPPLASLGGVTPLVMAITILATATGAAIVQFGVRVREPAATG
ncbi:MULTISPECIES: multidrug effflux MFS transporter [unclassified Pseudonocardia]|mgnify:CR=1 FL=1|uniref:multidrug effflux MFS transporter n=1 Tax=unclassified Pseudonocardia TaxID=2619320 RepID=UPI00095D6FA3|nr:MULTISPECIES: multidrug effflux MFS transporter [unclassified Pseudonocardia]MBN9100198.1 multidrug effflux MFS transporter [Pseudonocardia sp.]OJY50235.1 MAG: Bcr/CflA family drug resistance efflux transporter [Pseudonocardia sp. 73-21]